MQLIYLAAGRGSRLPKKFRNFPKCLAKIKGISVFDYQTDFFKQFKIKIFRAEKIKTHGGSIRIYLKKDKNVKIEKSVKTLLNEEEKFGIKDFKTYQEFGNKVYKIRDNVINNINKTYYLLYGN